MYLYKSDCFQHARRSRSSETDPLHEKPVRATLSFGYSSICRSKGRHRGTLLWGVLLPIEKGKISNDAVKKRRPRQLMESEKC